MGAQRLQTTRRFSTLRDQLSLYGLNPSQWDVSAKRRDSFELAHREDPAFRIRVQTRILAGGQIRVDDLALVSL